MTPMIDVTSPTFANGDALPAPCGGDDANLSPALAWGRPPASTKTFAIVCEDLDTRPEHFVHWIAWRIPVDQRAMHEGVQPSEDAGDLRQGRNDFGETGWAGPRPPAGRAHRYRFRVLAVDEVVDLPTGSSHEALTRALEGHVVGEGTILGTFKRGA